MYKCSFCGQVSEPLQRLNRVVTEYRRCQYQDRQGTTVGYEIVSEKNACGTCAITKAATPPQLHVTVDNTKSIAAPAMERYLKDYEV